MCNRTHLKVLLFLFQKVNHQLKVTLFNSAELEQSQLSMFSSVIFICKPTRQQIKKCWDKQGTMNSFRATLDALEVEEIHLHGKKIHLVKPH